MLVVLAVFLALATGIDALCSNTNNLPKPPPSPSFEDFVQALGISFSDPAEVAVR
jgi:hypothetical protein